MHGSTRDPSTAWQTAKGGEWRFMTFSGHVYRSHDFESWSSSNETLFPPAECPSLFKLPRDIRQASASEYAAKGAGGGGEGALAGDVKGNRGGVALPTHVYKGSGIHCLVNGQHAKVHHYSLLPFKTKILTSSSWSIIIPLGLQSATAT